MKNFTFIYTLSWLLAFGLLVGRPAGLRAQDYLLPVAGTATYTTCAGTLYDDGGPREAYDANADGSVTLLPGTPGSKLSLKFTDLLVDTLNLSLIVYDGPNTNSPIIGYFRNGLPTVYATGSTGALTVTLHSAGLTLRGFAATISCYAGAPPPPQLLVRRVELSSAVVPPGDYLSATARVANLAGGVAGYRQRFLLSTDTLLSANDISLSLSDYTLVAGTQNPYGQRLTVPDNTAPGPYYVLCQTEQALTLGSHPITRLSSAPLTVLTPTAIPDLTITDLAYDQLAVLGAGSGLYANARQQNLGSRLAQNAELGFYFSADSVLSADDQLLGHVLAEPPTSGKSSWVSTYFNLPTVVSPGTYYLLAVADYPDRVIEADEHNNTLALKLVVQGPVVDLAFGKLRSVAPNQPGAGDRLTAQCVLNNAGNRPVGAPTVGYYLSADRLLSADDVLVDHTRLGTSLSPGFDYYGYLLYSLTLPASTALGKYYLLVVADYRNEIAETDETNNVIALALEVVKPRVDLALSTVRNGSIYDATAGTTFYTRCTLANQGSTVAYPATVGYYFSVDNQLSVNDILLGQEQLSPLPGGSSQVLESQFLLPKTLPLGPGYLLFVADYRHEVAETDETNNVVALSIQVGQPVVDLTLSYNFTVQPAATSAGTEVQVAYYLSNLGTTPAQAPTTGFYLSLDDQLSADDLFVSSTQLAYNSVSPSSYIYLTSSVTVPATTPPGQYYLLGMADYLNEFAETDETNNVRAAPLEVTAARPDLLLLDAPYPTLLPGLVAAGGLLSATSYLYNQGDGPAGSSRMGYYLAKYPFTTPDDVLLGSTPTEALMPGYATKVADTFLVPPTTPPGRYYLLFVADYLHQQIETDLRNNLLYTTLTVLPAPLATRLPLAGYELAILPVPVASPAPLRVQASGSGPRLEAALALYNTLGQVVATGRLPLLPGQSTQAELPTAGLAAGVYVLRITAPGLSATRRVVVE